MHFSFVSTVAASSLFYSVKALVDPRSRFAGLNVSTTKVTGPVLQTSFFTPPDYRKRTHKTTSQLGGNHALVQSQLNHIALHVPDIEQATRFYTEILGFQSLRYDVLRYRRADNPDAPIFRIYDDDELNEVVIAFLSTSDGVGLELFQFIDPPMSEPATFNYRKGGVYHFAVTHPNPESLVNRVIEKGGKQIGETVILAPGTANVDAKVALYFQDPWGNTIEAMSCTFEEMTTYVK